jgi:hypothetical protein
MASDKPGRNFKVGPWRRRVAEPMAGRGYTSKGMNTRSEIQWPANQAPSGAGSPGNREGFLNNY